MPLTTRGGSQSYATGYSAPNLTQILERKPGKMPRELTREFGYSHHYTVGGKNPNCRLIEFHPNGRFVGIIRECDCSDCTNRETED